MPSPFIQWFRIIFLNRVHWYHLNFSRESNYTLSNNYGIGLSYSSVMSSGTNEVSWQLVPSLNAPLSFSVSFCLFPPWLKLLADYCYIVGLFSICYIWSIWHGETVTKGLGIEMKRAGAPTEGAHVGYVPALPNQLWIVCFHRSEGELIPIWPSARFWTFQAGR